MAHVIARWVCPLCRLKGQTSSTNPTGTSIHAHFRVVHPDVPIEQAVPVRGRPEPA